MEELSPSIQKKSLHLPPELWLQILPDLSPRDLKALHPNFPYRQLIHPFLFRRIKLSADSLAAFEEGGYLSHLRRNVKHITFTGLNERRLLQTLVLADLYTEVLESFTGVESLHIPFGATHHIREPLFIAILDRISLYPMYDTLKVLSVECEENQYKYDSDERRRLEAYLEEHKDDEDGFLFPLKKQWDWSHRDVSTTIEFPPALEEASIRKESYFYLEDNSSVYTNPFMIFQFSSATLRKLKISTERLHCGVKFDESFGSGRQREYDNLEKICYPNVTELWITIDYTVSNRNFWYLHQRFPHVEDLRIDGLAGYGSSIPQGKAIYKRLARLQYLKRVRLPWPAEEYHGMEENGEDKLVPQWRLRNAVDTWINAGLEDLEEVMFISRIRYTEKGKNNPTYKDANVLHFKVMKNWDEWDLKWREATYTPEEMQADDWCMDARQSDKWNTGQMPDEEEEADHDEGADSEVEWRYDTPYWRHRLRGYPDSDGASLTSQNA
ncbi:hypothetical protein TWF106_005711 [Orbilia oligospora]|uniref:F-box domain-containing protein n=1 Tax=Orbilia oligospora TaxID=2813651 RepID=A0A7C8UWH3_ORBOL|nr:hypothetical protein TWF788_003586 [Orbilia oligospora]KAF3214460.1 hypothetical protein TWF679_004835 [Orbilia oligospora]KAF3222301.1 hypothetical protein TWF106_005711 [Orbilia oligospora]